jgi:glycosyltransferase involved in cell wall biosynthesis
MRSIRILHVIRSLRPESGGPVEGVRRLAQIAKQQSYELETVSLDSPGEAFLDTLPFKTHALGPAWGKYGYTPRLSRWMKENAEHYDGIVINGLWQFHGYGTWKNIRGKVPYVVFTHGMLDPYFKRRYPLKHIKKWLYWAPFEYRLLKEANAVLFTSPLEKELAERSFWLHDWKPVVVPYGTTGPDFDVEESQAVFDDVFPQLRGRRFLLYLSRIDPKKGCDLLLRAFAKFAAAQPDLLLMMAGPDTGGWVPKLQALAKQLGVADRILWPGMLKDAIKWGAFYASEVYILPSHQENFGIAVAEALACGKPVLTTDQVNIWPDIAETESGLVETDTQQGIDRLLERWFATSEPDRESMSQRAMQLFGDRFSMQRTAASILQELGFSATYISSMQDLQDLKVQKEPV